MTSALGGVLSLALVLSTIGTASEGSADHDINSKMTPHIDHRDLYKPYIYPNMKSRTNIHRYSKYDDFSNNSQKSTKSINFKENFIINRDIRRNGGISGGVRRVKRSSKEDCEYFNYDYKKQNIIEHPHAKNNKTYSPNMNCPLVIQVSDRQGITLTFVDFFHIEDHPNCEYDFLEIREGPYGYGQLIGKYCGEKFPPLVMSTGPALWLKFKSDDTIEYEGFHISVNIQEKSNSRSVPKSCNHTMTGDYGEIDTEKINATCLTESDDENLDVIWSIFAPENYTIYLNFTDFSLAETNNCEANLVQVFGYVLEFDSKLAHYCGTIANPVMTSPEKDGKKDHPANIMYVRMFATKTARGKSNFKAKFTALRTTSECNKTTEFDCGDNTCIKEVLACNGYANCRLKTDEDPENCPHDPEMLLGKPHIMAILVIFSLILSGMSFVFLFKCIRKLYLDHKIIKEHIRQSCEDRLDTLIDSRYTLDAKKLQRDSVRASLERDNHTNEMVKQQRKLSQQQKHSSIDSDMIQETEIGFEPWIGEMETTPLEAASIKLERNGRSRKHDTSKREESLRRKRDRGSTEPKEKKEIRDASVSAPDTMESGCQTRESLFQAEIAPSEGSGNSSNSRGFSTFGYSGGTIVRPSPPAPIETAEITIELLSQVTPQESVKPQKKILDRRPMSTETTRSAPDVIIVSKPIH